MTTPWTRYGFCGVTTGSTEGKQAIRDCATNHLEVK